MLTGQEIICTGLLIALAITGLIALIDSLKAKKTQLINSLKENKS